MALETGRTVDIVAAAEGMRAMLRERADEIEAARRLPTDISDMFARAGFYRACVPEAYGGLELPPMQLMRTIEILAQADASAAWCAFIGATSGSVLALIPESAARQVFATPETLISGVFAPRGTAEAEDGGFRVNGRWQWGSGTQNADWILGGCMVIRDGAPELMANGLPQSYMMLVPAADVEFFDTWHVLGLCGSGSTDFGMTDLFVPDDYAVGFGVKQPLDRPLYAFPQFGLLAISIACVTLGLAQAAIDELVGFASAKTPVGNIRPLANRPHTQSTVAEAEAARRAARAFLYEAVEAAWDAACADGRITVEHKRDVRLATTHAVRACAQAVDLMYQLGGGTPVYKRSPLERIFRDTHVATQHMMVGPGSLELTGRLLLGLDTDTSLL